MELLLALMAIVATAIVAFFTGAKWGVGRCRKLHFHVHDSTTLTVEGRIDDHVANITPNSIIVSAPPNYDPERCPICRIQAERPPLSKRGEPCATHRMV